MRKRYLLGILLLAQSGLASVSVNVNGINYPIPQTNEKGWGANVTSWIQAISANTLQPSGGTFTLGAELDFGASFGVKSVYYKSRGTNVAGSGAFRLSNTDAIAFRNAGNTADLLLTPGASDGLLNYNGVKLLSSGSVVDADISASAAISRSKIAAGSATQVLINDGSGLVSSEAQLAPTRGGTGVSNSGTLTYGANNVTLSTSGATSLTLPTTGTVSTREASETLSGVKTISSALVLTEVATPAAAPASSVRLYAKSDDKVYRMDSSGAEKEIGGGALIVSGTRAAPNSITAAGGITATSNSRTMMFIQGSGGAVTVTANPQISAGTILGQELILIGRSDTNSITLSDGTGLSLNGPITLSADSVLSLVWDGTNWTEVSRRY